MSGSEYVLVNKDVLPGVYRQVLLAKELIASGEAASVTQAAKMAGISRSAYYKYKDFVFGYSSAGEEGIVTIKLKLKDNKGVLSAVINEIYRAGANVLSINQNVPNNSVADVSLTLYTADMNISDSELRDRLQKLDGVRCPAGQ
ncbi:MAG: ACT domain-containing protein [Clostridiales bacterium]|nr:ACT domain-containing protein [Clostridiales bacterium]